jgi:hypothetical protein
MNGTERDDDGAAEVRMTACGLGYKRIDLGGDPLGEVALSARDRAIVAFVRAYRAAHAAGPTVQEIAEAVGSRTRVANQRIAALVHYHVLLREKGVPRSLRPHPTFRGDVDVGKTG